jgi:AcrR family transcriptional regulator
MADDIISKGERTRAEIISAAYQLFLERGYHGTSIRQVAQQAGIALGSIYNHFSSKDDIFEAVLLSHHPYSQVLPAMKDAEGDNIEAFVRDAARRMVDGLEGHSEFLNLMFIELVEFRGRHVPLIFQSAYPDVLVFAQRFQQEEGQLRAIPVPILLRTFLGLFFSYVITELLMGTQMPDLMRQGALDYFVDIFLHGILVPPEAIKE